MAIRHLVWACVACKCESTLQPAKKGEVCSSCGTSYVRGRGSKIFVQQQGSEGRAYTPRELISLLPELSAIGTARAEVRDWVRDEPLKWGRYLGRYECLGDARAGRIRLDEGALHFDAEQGASFSVRLLDITAIQPSSSALQIKVRNRPVFSVRLIDSSPKLWEERLQLALSNAYARAGLGEIAEYQPRICPRPKHPTGATKSRIRKRIARAKNARPGPTWQYRLSTWIVRNAWKYLGGGLTVDGLSNIPASGPFLVLANHESYIETVMIPSLMPRTAHMMAKSTQFASRVSGWLMARLNTFPVRRFEIDPQAVRYVASRLSEGYGVVIFIEGERTWDGTLQAARLGTVRLALEAGVPVIPCRVQGAYPAWPRWSSKPQRHQVHLSFGTPIDLPPTASRSEREAQLETAIHKIRTAISSTSAS